MEEEQAAPEEQYVLPITIQDQVNHYFNRTLSQQTLKIWSYSSRTDITGPNDIHRASLDNSLNNRSSPIGINVPDTTPPIPPDDLEILAKIYHKKLPNCGRQRGAILRYIEAHRDHEALEKEKRAKTILQRLDKARAQLMLPPSGNVNRP